MYFMALGTCQSNVILLRPQLARRLHSQFSDVLNSLSGLDAFQKQLSEWRRDFCGCMGRFRFFFFLFYAQMSLFYITAFSSALVMHAHRLQNAR